jgi:hypothetical protein
MQLYHGTYAQGHVYLGAASGGVGFPCVGADIPELFFFLYISAK